MTILEALDTINRMKPNTYDNHTMIKWLSTLDGLIFRQVISTHEQTLEEGEEPMTFEGYTDDTPLSTELIVGEPYDEIYASWLEAKIDYANGDIQKYNNSVVHYNDIYQSYVDDYNRTHMPLTNKFKFF